MMVCKKLKDHFLYTTFFHGLVKHLIQKYNLRSQPNGQGPWCFLQRHYEETLLTFGITKVCRLLLLRITNVYTTIQFNPFISVVEIFQTDERGRQIDIAIPLPLPFLAQLKAKNTKLSITAHYKPLCANLNPTVPSDLSEINKTSNISEQSSNQI